MRRKAAIIGELPLGSTCALSAVTGLPALSVPAGFTRDGLPIGAELLGRPFADATLLALAYDYEQSVHPRRAPSTTPPLVGGEAPPPMRFETTARGTGVVANGSFAYDPTRRSLAYRVQLTGQAAGTVATVSIARDSAGIAGPIIRRLLAQGERVSNGSTILDGEERQDLLAGRLSLAVFSTERAGAVAREPLVRARERARK